MCLAAVALALSAHAQTPCPHPDLSDHPGAWKARAGYRGGGQFKAPPGSYNRAAAGAILDKLLALLQAAYPEPRGGMAYFTKYLHFSTSDPADPRNQFGYSLHVGHTGFYCTSANRLVESGESGVWIGADVNQLPMLVEVAPPTILVSGGEIKLNTGPNGRYHINGQPVYQAPSVHDRYRGIERYVRASRKDSSGAPTEQFLLVGPGEKQLVSYVNRREYLRQFRGELETYQSRETEAYRANAGTPGASSAEWLARFVRMMTGYIRAVDAYLKNSTEAELNRPVSELLPLFPADPDNPQVKFRDGDYHLVFVNAGYFDRRLPHHIPQSIVITLSIRDMENPPAWERRFRDSISNQLDFAAIKALLGKP